MGNRWAIYDDEGDIYEGDEDFILDIWDQIEKGSLIVPDIKGDLRLAEIHARRH